MDMFAEQNNKQNNHRHSPAESSRDCSPFYPEFGKTELTKNQRIVTDDIKNIDYHCYQHRIYSLIGTA